MDESEVEALHFAISGRVQGVFFRASMAALDALVAWAETGPPAARVDACIVSPAEADAALHDFTQAATA